MSLIKPSYGSETVFPLEELSWSITKNASVVSQYLGSRSLPQPSFESDGPSTIVPGDAPQHIRQALQQLVATSLEMSQLAIGPSEFLPNLATGVRHAPFPLQKLQEVLTVKSFNISPVSPGFANTTFSALCPRAGLSATQILPRRLVCLSSV